MNKISRRRVLQLGAASIAAVTISKPLAAQAQGRILGTVVDYAAGVPNAADIKAAGHLGSVRYVSERRPGTEGWMLGKPVTLAETRAQSNAGLQVASVYQFGKGNTADWLQGADGADRHAAEAIRIHRAAGGPTNRPIYVAIDDNPTWNQYANQIRPYLQRFDTLLKRANLILGIYGNYNVIDWASKDGLGSFYWQHDWGSGGKIHPRVTIHQKAGYRARISGVEVDVNNVYASDWGQWTPGSTSRQPANTAPAATNPATTSPSIPLPNIPGVDLGAINSSVPQVSSSIPQVSQSQVDAAMNLVRRFT